MSDGKQKSAFLEYEANQWFKRNFEALKNYREKDDKIICLLKDYKIEPVRILEIGCSAGHRLNGLKKTYPLTDVYGGRAIKGSHCVWGNTLSKCAFFECNCR
ncbi:hypothetical protein [Flavisolibacter ginsengisoli]|jgi:hypothetical protein|uniref:hypothetical protein n=1 Tax=Flavisolibacter ginsengisoli TaxID=462367 RepID=UPI001587CA4F|nr:hypothetical protein [Flavisolibacter ginsengisoli]